ncbi:MAG: hypothetical protein KDD52_06680 [Bdellovibrionales bacterium]|nr:hypothetical protein [Bdellovibrionales bacterium]
MYRLFQKLFLCLFFFLLVFQISSELQAQGSQAKKFTERFLDSIKDRSLCGDKARENRSEDFLRLASDYESGTPESLWSYRDEIKGPLYYKRIPRSVHLGETEHLSALNKYHANQDVAYFSYEAVENSEVHGSNLSFSKAFPFFDLSQPTEKKVTWLLATSKNQQVLDDQALIDQLQNTDVIFVRGILYIWENSAEAMNQGYFMEARNWLSQIIGKDRVHLLQNNQNQLASSSIKQKSTLQNLEALLSQIKKKSPEGNVLFISHSKGGLDTLHAINSLGENLIENFGKVSWLTIQSPFHGALASTTNVVNKNYTFAKLGMALSPDTDKIPPGGEYEFLYSISGPYGFSLMYPSITTLSTTSLSKGLYDSKKVNKSIKEWASFMKQSIEKPESLQVKPKLTETMRGIQMLNLRSGVMVANSTSYLQNSMKSTLSLAAAQKAELGTPYVNERPQDGAVQSLNAYFPCADIDVNVLMIIGILFDQPTKREEEIHSPIPSSPTTKPHYIYSLVYNKHKTPTCDKHLPIFLVILLRQENLGLKSKNRLPILEKRFI